MPKNMKGWVYGIGVLVVVGVLFAMGGNGGFKKATVTDPEKLANVQINIPWDNGNSGLSTRLSQIGFPQLLMEGTVLHIHQHLDLMINGTPVEIPAGIGIGLGGSFYSPIHVHDTRGVIHVESPTQQTFYLGEFFDVWGVKFTKDCIGQFCESGDNHLKVYVNGMLTAGDPRKIELQPHEEILVAYGTDAQLPKTIPSTYQFRIGE